MFQKFILCCVPSRLYLPTNYYAKNLCRCTNYYSLYKCNVGNVKYEALISKFLPKTICSSHWFYNRQVQLQHNSNNKPAVSLIKAVWLITSQNADKRVWASDKQKCVAHQVNDLHMKEIVQFSSGKFECSCCLLLGSDTAGGEDWENRTTTPRIIRVVFAALATVKPLRQLAAV